MGDKISSARYKYNLNLNTTYDFIMVFVREFYN